MCLFEMDCSVDIFKVNLSLIDKIGITIGTAAYSLLLASW